jgi:predicted porin
MVDYKNFYDLMASYLTATFIFMKHFLRSNNRIFLIIPIIFSLNIHSSSDFYGKINVSLAQIDNGTDDETDTLNNASRIGFKSKFKLSENLNFLLQVENEIDPTDGRADGDKVFKQRNTFVGISGNFGKLFIGTHDTAFKKGQLKIDLFNDTQSDIKNILRGENRMQDLIGYESPELFNGIKVVLNNIKTSDKSYQSYSINYSSDSLKASYSIDTGLKGYDGKRLSISYSANKTTIGAIYQDTEKTVTSNKESGFVYSVKQKISNKGSLLFQVAESDMKVMGGKQTSFGYNHQVRKELKVFTALSVLSKDNAKDKDWLTVGFEYKF